MKSCNNCWFWGNLTFWSVFAPCMTCWGHMTLSLLIDLCVAFAVLCSWCAYAQNVYKRSLADGRSTCTWARSAKRSIDAKDAIIKTMDAISPLEGYDVNRANTLIIFRHYITIENIQFLLTNSIPLTLTVPNPPIWIWFCTHPGGLGLIIFKWSSTCMWMYSKYSQSDE